ncbi:Srp72p [Coemansia sp. RSA 353]|nr:Srp72p [Coemansia sp. RSA 353]
MVSIALESHFAAIRDAITGNDLALVVELTRTALKDYTQEVEFVKIQVVALIKLEKPAQALDVLDKARSTKVLSANAMAYESAYCHFALENYGKAEDALKSVKAGPGADRLAAQIAYKSNRFAKCIEIYNRLFANAETSSSERDELELNLAAAKAAAAQVSKNMHAGSSISTSTDNYELMFNQATELLACGKAKEAVVLLEASETRAKAELAKEDWSAEDIQSEISPIQAQKAVALQCLEKVSDARAIYVSLLSDTTLDTAARAIVIHNAATLGAQGDTLGVARTGRIKRAIQSPGNSASGLSHYQRALMTYNMAVVQSLQKQYTAARRSLGRIAKEYAECTLPNAGVLSAGISLKMNNANKALNELSAISHARGAVEGVYATLAAVQIALALGETKRALDILCVWRDKAQNISLVTVAKPDVFVRYYFGICQLIDWLSPESSTLAADAARHVHVQAYQQQTSDAALLAAVGDCLVYAGDIEKARTCFSDATTAASSSGAHVGNIQSMFIAAVLASDKTGIQSTAQLLRGYNRRKQIVSLIPGIPPHIVRKFQPRSEVERKDAFGAQVRALATGADKRRKKNQALRCRKLAKSPPKNYEPGRVPDSERWIPLRQRSYYRPRKRSQRQHKMRSGAQGGATEAGSGLGGTGSARISKKDPGPAVLAIADSKAQDSHNGADLGPSGSSNKTKPKNAKGKGKNKGKKSSW